MPTSNLHTWPEIINLVHQVDHDHILDVGPGWGKGSVLLREYLNVKPKRIDAVEAVKEYVDRHGLRPLYDEIWIGDVCDLTDEQLAEYDVVLMIDVIEHLEDAAAFDLLKRIPGRTIISTPVDWFQTDGGLPEPEQHRSHWSASSWEQVAGSRPVEVCYQSLGAWLVRFGPLR